MVQERKQATWQLLACTSTARLSQGGVEGDDLATIRQAANAFYREMTAANRKITFFTDKLNTDAQLCKCITLIACLRGIK